ncbi:hypothetical protein [Actinosynnema sp. NPDC023587]|uniref:hypothetical protein n=1 Tax=Actinosynnema sp. NPDC023587 TaxID=3154695 RepID=UPI0033C040A3
MTRVRFVPGDREVDLDRLSASDYAAITALRGTVRRGDRVLLCVDQPDHDEMFVREVGGRYFASHFAGGGHGAHEIRPEPDEHKRQREYWQRAGDDAEFRSDSSLRTSAGNLLDIAIHGPTRTGVAVSRPRVTAAAARRSTGRSHRAGWLSLWFTAADRDPRWLHRVPSVGCNHIAWDDLPPRGSAVATGLRKVGVARCTVHDFPVCPEGNRNHCGKEHPTLVPWPGVTLDHVAYLVPSGRAVPLVTVKDRIFLVPPEGLGFYESVTGRPARYLPEKVSHSALRCVECDTALHWIRPGRVRCERCFPIMRLATSPYPL